MHLIIGPSICVLSGQTDIIEKINKYFFFKNKGREADLRRLNKTLQFKERLLYNQNGGSLPDWYPKWKKDQVDAIKSKIEVYICTKMADGSLIVPTGLVPRLKAYSVTEKFPLQIDDMRDFASLNRRNLKGEKPRELRKPQKLAMEAIENPLPENLPGIGLIEMATGIGKTAYAQETIRQLGHKAIFLVPSVSILNQTLKRFKEAFGENNVKKYGDGQKNIGYVTVATYQSVYSGDAEDFSDIDVAIMDEVHHVAAETFYDVATQKLKNAVVRIGLTAYKERADGSTMLIEAACGPVIYSYTAAEAIADGYLAKPTFIVYSVTQTAGTWTKYKINTKTKKREATKVLPCIKYQGKDDIEAYRNWILGNNILNSFVTTITNSFVEEGKSVLIMIDEKEHGDKLIALMPEAGLVVGGGKDNEDLLKAFNARKLKVLIGTSTIGEGTDTVPVDVLIQLQGGASASKTVQIDGRALRNDPDPDTGVPRKPTTLIIDFDFPDCQKLHGQAEARIKIHKLIGEINRISVPNL